jgi:iron complex outermembrane recepter protein
MNQSSPLSLRPLTDAACRPTSAAQAHHSSFLRKLPATVSLLALFACFGEANAQQAAPAASPSQPAQQPAEAASPPQPQTQPQTGQVTLRPVDVTAVKPKKVAKKRPAAPARAPIVANTAAQQGAQSGISAPVKVQAKTQLGRLTIATPMAGTVVIKEDIEQIRPADVQRELLPQIPGVSMVRNLRIPIGGKAYTNDLLDGYSMKSASLGNVGFLDEVNTWDIESIEITRGPGSVLHSSKAVGGTINVITRDPPLKPEVGVWGDAGTYGLRRLGAHAAGSSEDGALGFSIDASHMQDEGWRERSEREKESISGKFVMKPDADTKITFRSEYVDSYKEYPAVLSQEDFDQNWRQTGKDSKGKPIVNLYEDLQYYTTMAELKRRIGLGGELTLAWVDHKTWGTNACPAGCSSPAAATTQVEMDYDDTSLRAVYRQDFDFLKSRVYVGVDGFLSEKDDDTFARNGFVLIKLNKSYALEETTIAPFAQYEFSPLERLRFTLGVRQENYELDVNDLMASNKDGTKEYDALVRKGGVTYEYANNHYIWGGIAEGFYVPSTDSTVTGANAHDLPPETSLTYSAGIRGALPRQRITYDVGYYHTVINDMAISMPCTNSIDCPDSPPPYKNATYPVAAGKLQFEGIETTASWHPIDLIKFGASYTYALNTFVEYKDSTGDYAGKDYYYSPEHHLNGRVTIYPIKGLSVELESDYISSYFTNFVNSDTYQRPTLYNMRVGYDAGNGMELWAHAYNLFDVKYAERVSATNTIDLTKLEHTYSEGYHPLTVRAGISYKW